MINDNAKFLTDVQLEEHVSRLNKEDIQALATEWEIVVLHSFSKIGKIQHEPNLNGPSNLDLLFTHHQDKAQFVADITTVSDEKFETETPLNAFDIEFTRRIRKSGLRGNSFGYTVGIHPSNDIKIKLMLPPRHDFSKEIFNEQFRQFLNHIRQHPGETHSHQISTTNTNVFITYNPSQKFASSGGCVYTQAISKTKNPVYNALEDKARQLKKISYSGPKGIIICDGGSDMFHSKPSGSFRPYFNASEVIKEFLRQHNSIDFILMLSSVHINSSKSRVNLKRPFLKVKVELFPNVNFTKIPSSIRNSLAELEKYFPEPVNIAHGARATIRHGFDPKKFITLMEGFSISENEIKLSANDVLGLLAGLITQEEFLKFLKSKLWYNSKSTTWNPFEYFLSQGMRIVEIKGEDKDDFSYLIFKFDGPDAAISSFINPKANLGKKNNNR